MHLRALLPETIETERLVLRQPRVSDLDDLVAGANNWKVIEPTATLPFPYEAQHGATFLGKTERQTQHPYVIATRGDDRLIGVIGLTSLGNEPVQLGYWLGEAHWGKGLAGEAVNGLMRACDEAGIGPIRAKVLENNPGSLRVLEKTGFAIVERTTSVVERHRGKPLLVFEREAVR